LHGEFVKKDFKKAFELLKIAASENMPAAFYDLAVCFETGKGIKKDTKNAFENYLKASLLGDKQSIYEVGRCYYYGIGVGKNLQLSKIWLDAAKFWKVS
jgi:TPR repeat protein